jgi:hypothetical protein
VAPLDLFGKKRSDGAADLYRKSAKALTTLQKAPMQTDGRRS